MEIIMTRLTFFAASLVLVVPFFSNQVFAGEECVSGSAVIREMNLARQNPALYASYIEELRSHFDGRFLVLPGHMRLCTKEGLGAIDDAVRFLRSVRPLPALTLSPGMCRGAADHCAEQMNGAMGHDGSDRSNPGARMSRYGAWSSSWGENIARTFLILTSITPAQLTDRTRVIAASVASISPAVIPSAGRSSPKICRCRGACPHAQN